MLIVILVLLGALVSYHIATRHPESRIAALRAVGYLGFKTCRDIALTRNMHVEDSNAALQDCKRLGLVDCSMYQGTLHWFLTVRGSSVLTNATPIKRAEAGPF